MTSAFAGIERTAKVKTGAMIENRFMAKSPWRGLVGEPPGGVMPKIAFACREDAMKFF
jgi:hypothetical protein